jgi:hypothetical protein
MGHYPQLSQAFMGVQSYVKMRNGILKEVQTREQLKLHQQPAGWRQWGIGKEEVLRRSVEATLFRRQWGALGKG